MDAMETALAGYGNQSSRTLQLSLSRWSELVSASVNAAGALAKSVRLAESRRIDALKAGFSVPADAAFSLRTAEASRRLQSLVSQTKIQMTRINDELTRRQPRRHQTKLYRGNSPSHVDVHV